MTTLDVADAGRQERLGALLAAGCPRPAVVYLEGDLGVGKTTLARGFLRALGQTGAVRSPTYTLVEPYDLAAGPVFHLDLYRLADAGELEYLGLRDLTADGAILLVEWPERGEGSLPPPDLRIRISHQAAGRRVELEAVSPPMCLLVAKVASALFSGELQTKADRRP